jgi:anti-sigma regulatory factor (Ser/Thr protein kinase)
MGSVSAGEQQGSTQADPVEHTWEAGTLRLSEARTVVSRWLEAHRRAELESALHLVITELLSNAREASKPTDPITLRLDLDDEAVDIEVENTGQEFDPSFDMPDALALCGRGLSLVSAIADTVVVEHSRGRTRVAARFRL